MRKSLTINSLAILLAILIGPSSQSFAMVVSTYPSVAPAYVHEAGSYPLPAVSTAGSAIVPSPTATYPTPLQVATPSGVSTTVLAPASNAVVPGTVPSTVVVPPSRTTYYTTTQPSDLTYTMTPSGLVYTTQPSGLVPVTGYSGETTTVAVPAQTNANVMVPSAVPVVTSTVPVVTSTVNRSSEHVPAPPRPIAQPNTVESTTTTVSTTPSSPAYGNKVAPVAGSAQSPSNEVITTTTQMPRQGSPEVGSTPSSTYQTNEVRQ
jgi:hypothetical protein